MTTISFTSATLSGTTVSGVALRRRRGAFIASDVPGDPQGL